MFQTQKIAQIWDRGLLGPKEDNVFHLGPKWYPVLSLYFEKKIICKMTWCSHFKKKAEWCSACVGAHNIT